MLGIEDFWNVDIVFAAGHFKDVCISKEGHAERVSTIKNILQGKRGKVPGSEQNL